MALIIKDRVKEITTTTGTGDVSLGGASATFDAFQSVMSNGDTTFYAIVHTASGTDEWEVGVGTFNTGNTLTRTTVYAGSNGASAVNFSSGNKDVFMTYPASKAAVAGEDVTFADVTATDITATGTVTLSGDPTSALQAATKEYVDTIAAAGIHYHTPVRVESPDTAGNLNATYDNGSSGVGATLTNAGTQAALVIDGVTLNTNDRVLIYSQTNGYENGIYTVTNTGSASTNWVLTRATDADSYGASDQDALGEGDAFFVKEGDTGAGELYVMNTSGVITFGTTNISFTVVAETAVYSAGTGLTLTGTTFSTNQDISTSASPTFNNITVTGTVDGRDVATDGSKLDGIEAGATADQTAAEIKTAYESNSDTNAFTDAEKTKLSGIETGATGDQTASEILTAIKTVDGAASGLDADLLDGQQGSYYLNTGTTFSGDVSGTYNNIVVANDSHTHDGRYYTETEADNRFVNVTGDTMSGALTVSSTITATGNIYSRNGDNSDIVIGEHPSYTNYGAVWLDGESDYRFLADPSGGHTYINALGSGNIYFRNDNGTLVQVNASGTMQIGANTVFHDGYHPNADKWTTARTLSLSGDASGSVSWDGSANATLSVTVANDSHTHDGRYYTESEADSRFTSSDHFKWRGTSNLGSTTTSALKTELLSRDVFDSYVSAFKTSWSYAGNADLTDAGRLTELAGTSWLTWTDNSADNTQGNFTALVIAPNTGGSAGKMFVYNDQGSGYAPGWREIWTSLSDGSGSGLDADLLDGVHGSSFLRSDADDTTSGVVTFGPNSSWNKYLKIGGNANNSDANSGSIGVTNGNLHLDAAQGAFVTYLNFYDGTGGVAFGNGAGSSPVAWMGPDGDLWKGSADNTGSKYWHAGNDGSSSGLDADLLDGYHLSTTRNAANTVPVRDGNGYLQLGWINTTSGATTSTINKIYASYDDYVRYITPATLISQLNLSTTSHNHTYDVNNSWLRDNGDNANVKLYGNTRQMAFRTDGTTEYASGVGGYPFAWMYGGDASGNRIMLLTTSGDLWTNTNGWLSTALSGKLSTSGKAADSDLLDGQDSSYYAAASSLGSYVAKNTGYTWTGVGGSALSFRSNDTLETSAGDQAALEVFQDNSGADAFMQFHVGGDYAAYFGLKGDINDFAVGGWSMGNNYYRVWHAGNDGSGSGLDADLLDGQHGSYYYPASNPNGYTTNVGDITSVSAGSGLAGGGTSGAVTISHADTSSQASVNNSGRTYIQDITLDTYGHIIGITSATETVVNTDTNTTYSAGTGLDLTGTVFSVEPNQRGDITTFGYDTSNYVDSTGSRVSFYFAGNEKFRCDNSGNLHADGNITAYSTTISDERLKENIEPITGALDKINQINGYTFTYKKDGRQSAGVIAQEVENVLPSSVMDTEIVFHGEEGKTYKTVQYDQLTALFIEAIKDLKAEVDELKAEIEELKNGSSN